MKGTVDGTTYCGVVLIWRRYFCGIMLVSSRSRSVSCDGSRSPPSSHMRTWPWTSNVGFPCFRLFSCLEGALCSFGGGWCVVCSHWLSSEELVSGGRFPVGFDMRWYGVPVIGRLLALGIMQAWAAREGSGGECAIRVVCLPRPMLGGGLLRPMGRVLQMRRDRPRMSSDW